MSKTTAPKLRFPEFLESGEWEFLPIGKRVDLLTGYPFDGVDISENSTGTRLLRGINITEGAVRRSKEIDRYYLGSTDELEKFRVQKNDLVIGMDGSKVGKNSAIISESNAGTLLVQRVARLRSENVSTIQFIFQQINSSKFHAYVDRINTSSGIPHISSKQISDFQIGFPSVAEQQKIADCLTALDELIAAERAQLEALKAYKKGLLQHLFPAEGESVPALRFPEFQSAGEWEEKTLGELGDVLMCKRIFAEETNDREGVPFFKIGTLGSKPDAFISKDLFDEYKTKYNFPRKGEILITCSGTVGKCLAYDGNDAYYQDSNIVWIDNPTLEISNEFLHSILLNVDWGKLNSTTITRIYMSDLRDLSVVFPTNKKEQEKIAEALTSIDEAIAAQGQRVAGLGVHKQGLLQGLFP